MKNSLAEAEEYRLFGHPGTELQDCDFLEAVFASASIPVQKILDIACGTGRHAVEMARRGYAVTGVDISPDMLAAARQEAQAQGLEIELLQEDMRELHFPQAFDAAYILFNTMCLLTRNEELLAFLKGVHIALKPGGLLVIEVGNLWPSIASGKLANGSFSGDEERQGIRRRREMEFIIGPYNNLMCHLDHKCFWRGEEELEPKSRTVLLRIFSLNELDLLCRLTGYTIQEVYGATDPQAKILDPDKSQKLENPNRSYVLLLKKITHPI
jgi:SAM-dependent methyltransferase